MHTWGEWKKDPTDDSKFIRICSRCNSVQNGIQKNCPNSGCENGQVWEDWNYNIATNWIQVTCRECEGRGFVIEPIDEKRICQI